MIWDQAAINDLRTLWSDKGLSTTEIGRRMGCSKNAVVGKKSRLELEPRPSPILRGGRTALVAMRAAVTGDNPTLPALPSLSAPLPKPAVVVFQTVAAISDTGRPVLPTEERNRRILAMGNVSQSQCAKALGISHHAVRYVREKHRGTAPEATARAAQSPCLAVAAAPQYRAPTPAPPSPAPAIYQRQATSCCWPTGERTSVYHTHRFCGCAEVVPGKPYCAEHTKLAYVRVRYDGATL